MCVHIRVLRPNALYANAKIIFINFRNENKIASYERSIVMLRMYKIFSFWKVAKYRFESDP